MHAETDRRTKPAGFSSSIPIAAGFSGAPVARFYSYEAAKSDFIARNPSATPAEYEAAIQALAAGYGV